MDMQTAKDICFKVEEIKNASLELLCLRSINRNQISRIVVEYKDGGFQPLSSIIAEKVVDFCISTLHEYVLLLEEEIEEIK
jgi:hypothetical protein